MRPRRSTGTCSTGTCCGKTSACRPPSYLDRVGADDLRIGDMSGFDISHPCLTFDKWRSLPVLDAEYQVIDIVQAFF